MNVIRGANGNMPYFPYCEKRNFYCGLAKKRINSGWHMRLHTLRSSVSFPIGSASHDTHSLYISGSFIYLLYYLFCFVCRDFATLKSNWLHQNAIFSDIFVLNLVFFMFPFFIILLRSKFLHKIQPSYILAGQRSHYFGCSEFSMKQNWYEMHWNRTEKSEPKKNENDRNLCALQTNS